MPGFGVDLDGDVEMTMPQPIFEFIKAPRLTVWSQQALVKYLRDRRHYEDKMQERCAVTGEVFSTVIVSVKTSVEPVVLDHVCRFILKKSQEDVTDDDMINEIVRKAGAMLNEQVPDVERLFQTHLKMDFKESDIEARISKYFMDFQRLVDDNGLSSILGTGSLKLESDRARMKLRCKMLIQCLQPESLKTEMMRLVKWTNSNAKSNDVELFELVVKRAIEQQHHHAMFLESKIQGGKQKENHSGVQRLPERVFKDKPRASVTRGALRGGAKTLPNGGCLFCKGNHWLRDCPRATDAEKTISLQRMRENRDRKEKLKRVVPKSTYAERRMVVINDILEVPFCPDTGADRNIVSRQVINELIEVGVDVNLMDLSPPVVVVAAGGTELICNQSTFLSLKIETAAGPVHVNSVDCLILEQDEEEFLLGKATMQSLGIDIDMLFEQLAARNNSSVDAGADDIPEDYVNATQGVVVGEIQTEIDRMLDDAVREGFAAENVDQLRDLMSEYKDVWRLHVGVDPPALVTPLEVQLLPNSVPCRSMVRRYPEAQRNFLRRYVRELEAAGLVYRNMESRWASPALPIRKAGTNEFRITVDYRPVNHMIRPLAGAAPNLNVVTQSVKGAYGFGTFDFYKGFWQLPLHENSQELFSFVTEDGVFTPLRVPQGACDSAVHFQSQMHCVFKDMLHESILVWIDDVLLFARTAADYVLRLREFLEVVHRTGLKLNAKKCRLFAKKVVWCGKLVDGEGVSHDPKRLEGLREIPLPPTGAALQTFLCALNWLRDSMVDYARTVGPLQEKLEKLMQVRGRRKNQLRGASIEWTESEALCFARVQKMVEASSKMYFPDKDARVCLFTDASNIGWAMVLTQVKEWRDAFPVGSQQHELLVCRGGCFKNAQANWSVAEKEAYPIVKACVDLDYMLDRENGFHIYCDHSNLIKIFAPRQEIKQHVKGKLLRWALKLADCRYVIEHIPGEENVWADMVSRWAGPAGRVFGAKRVTTRSAVQLSPFRPLQDSQFVWPRLDEIQRIQMQHLSTAPPGATNAAGVLMLGRRVWIPKDAKDLVTRLLVIAHCGTQGHRGMNVMQELLGRRFEMEGLRNATNRFVNACLLCKHVKGGMLIKRDPTVNRVVSKRNEFLHVDFLYLGDSYGADRYILVLKDELTQYCELVPTDSASCEVVVDAILDWSKRFGMPKAWVSDNGTHFKNRVLSDLAQRVGAAHTFVPVYTPWINGTVERVNRDVLQVLRVLLIELKWDTRNWVHLLPLIQANLNHSPVASLGNCAPVELFTGLEAQSALDVVAKPTDRGTELSDISLSSHQEAVDKLRKSLHEMHQTVGDARERRRLLGLVNAKGTACNFSVGDYVLWSRVDKRVAGGKLLARWVGPFRVVEALPHSFLVENILTSKRYDVHGSRLKFYSDADLAESAELREHVALQGIVLEVRAIVDHRLNRASGDYELRVAWRGLQDEENSWEPFQVIYQDVPILVSKYVNDHDVAVLQQLL